jgi:hypothetical protein
MDSGVSSVVSASSIGMGNTSLVRRLILVSVGSFTELDCP